MARHVHSQVAVGKMVGEVVEGNDGTDCQSAYSLQMEEFTHF